jgi:hypothetical protein
MPVNCVLSDAGTNSHDFDCDYSNPCVVQVGRSASINVPKEVSVWIKTYTYTMDEEYGKLGVGQVGSIPIREALSWRLSC